MSKMTRMLVSLLALSAVPGLVAAQVNTATPLDIHKILENESVTVVRIRLRAHAKTVMHDVTPRVVLWLTDARLRLTFPDGASRVELHKAGDVAWVPAMRHSGENLGDHPIVFLAVIPNARPNGPGASVQSRP